MKHYLLTIVFLFLSPLAFSALIETGLDEIPEGASYQLDRHRNSIETVNTWDVTCKVLRQKLESAPHEALLVNVADRYSMIDTQYLAVRWDYQCDYWDFQPSFVEIMASNRWCVVRTCSR